MSADGPEKESIFTIDSKTLADLANSIPARNTPDVFLGAVSLLCFVAAKLSITKETVIDVIEKVWDSLAPTVPPFEDLQDPETVQQINAYVRTTTASAHRDFTSSLTAEDFLTGDE